MEKKYILGKLVHQLQDNQKFIAFLVSHHLLAKPKKAFFDSHNQFQKYMFCSDPKSFFAFYVIDFYYVFFQKPKDGLNPHAAQ